MKWRSVIEQKFVALTTEHTNKLRDKLLGLETVENQQTEKMVDYCPKDVTVNKESGLFSLIEGQYGMPGCVKEENLNINIKCLYY